MNKDDMMTLVDEMKSCLDKDEELVRLVIKSGDMVLKTQTELPHIVDSFKKDPSNIGLIIKRINLLDKEDFIQMIVFLIWYEAERQAAVDSDQRDSEVIHILSRAYEEKSGVSGDPLNWNPLIPVSVISALTILLYLTFGRDIIKFWITVATSCDDNYESWDFPLEDLIDSLEGSPIPADATDFITGELLKNSPGYTAARQRAKNGDYEGALEIADKISIKWGKIKALLSISQLYSEEGKLVEAKKYLFRACNTAQEIEVKFERCACLLQIVKALNKTGNMDKAKEIALEHISSINSFKSRAIKSVIMTLAEKGFHKEAIELCEEFGMSDEELAYLFEIAIGFELRGEHILARKYIDQMRSSYFIPCSAGSHKKSKTFFDSLMDIAYAKKDSYLCTDLLIALIMYASESGSDTRLQEIIELALESVNFEKDELFRELLYYRPLAYAFAENSKPLLVEDICGRVPNSNTYINSLNILAGVCSGSGDNKMSLEYFFRATVINFESEDRSFLLDEETHLILARIFTELNWDKEAIKSVEDIVLPDNQSRILTEIAISQIERGFYDRALATIDLIFFDFERAEAYASISVSLRKRGDREKADKAVTRAFSILENLTYNIEITKINIAGNLLSGDRNREAVILLNEAFSSLLNGRDEMGYKEHYLRLIADCFIDYGEHLRGKEVYDQLIAEFGEVLKTSYEIKKMCHQAEFYMDKGEEEKSLDIYDEILEIAKHHQLDMYSIATMARSFVGSGQARKFDRALENHILPDRIMAEFIPRWRNMLLDNLDSYSDLLRKSFLYDPFDKSSVLNKILVLLFANIKQNKADAVYAIIDNNPRLKLRELLMID